MKSQQLQKLICKTLDANKAVDITVLDVRKLTEVTDYMIICSGTSNRHTRALADKVVEQSKQNGVRPLGVEGEQAGEWILIDLVDVVIHIMLPAVRTFYNLEKLWGTQPAQAVSKK